VTEIASSSSFDRIAAVCREHPLREKILVSPSLAIGHQIGDRIARCGTAWVNLRPETVRTLADAVTADGLAAEGITVLSRAQALALVEMACAGVPGERLAYFGALADRPGLHRAIQRSIDDLRLAGATAATLRAAAFEDPRKAEDLRCILESYERALAEGKFIDRAGVVLRAVRQLEGGARRPWPADAVWIVVDEEERAEVEGRLVSLASGWTLQSPDGVDSEESTHLGSAEFQFVKAAGEENEIRAAFRAILGEGRSFDEAEIAYATREIYLPLAWELASEYAIPATFSEGIAVHYTRPGKAAVELLLWIETWEDVHLRRAAQAGVLELEDPLNGASFARTLREAAIGWGRERHLVRLAALETERIATLEKKKLESEDEPWMSDRIERTRSTTAVVESLLALAPAEEESLPISTLASALAEIVEPHAAVKSEIDGMARSAICGMLRELAAIPGESLSKGETCDRIREALLELHVGASNPRPGHVHVAPIRAAGWSGRPMLFVVGLEEGRYPGGGTQDPILLDAERSRINEEIDPHQLPLLADRPRRVTAEFWRMLRRVAEDPFLCQEDSAETGGGEGLKDPAPNSGGQRKRSSATVTLSWPSIDLRERREKFPSQVILEVFRGGRGSSSPSATGPGQPVPTGPPAQPIPTYDDLQRAAMAVGFVDSRPLSFSEWWLHRAFGDGRHDLGEAPMQAYPWLADGRRAAEARATEEITAWDGKVDATPEELDPRNQDRLYSASRLERMAACPFGYFLQSILGIEPLETIDRSEEWLSPMEYGSVFHTVLETFMREICSRGEKPGFERHRERLAEIATAELERMRNEIPPPSDSAFDARREDLIEACAVFLRVEEKRCGEVDAKYFEVPFGFDDPEAELSMAEPLAVDLGRGRSVRLRGYIDRVDHHPGRDEWHVWDYKSGSPWKFKQPGSLAGGTMIQHAIYARAVNEMLDRRGEKGRVAESGYYFPTVKGRGERIAKVSDQASLETTLNHLFDVVGSGWFPQGDLERCKFCEFPSICQKTKESVEEQRAQCAANADDPAVDAWIRLQEVK